MVDNKITNFAKRLIEEIEAMRDNRDIEEELANYKLIPLIEDLAEEYNAK